MVRTAAGKNVKAKLSLGVGQHLLLNAGSVPHPSEIGHVRRSTLLSCVLLANTQHSVKALSQKNTRVFPNSLHCQYHTSPSQQVQKFGRVRSGLIVLGSTLKMKNTYFPIIRLSHSPPCLVLYGPKGVTQALKKDAYLPPKKYSSTSTQWFSNIFIQHLYSQTKHNIQSESNGSNLNKMSKNFFKLKQPTDVTRPRWQLAQPASSLERETKPNQVNRPCIGFSRALINIWCFLQSLFFVHGQWELLFRKW